MRHPRQCLRGVGSSQREVRVAYIHCDVCATREHRLAIELDGGVHSQIDQMRKDAAKEDYLRTLGIRLMRIPNAMVLEHPDEFVHKVLETIGASVEKAKK